VSVSDALRKVLGFLRAGYPEGVPEADREPLLALLRRRLSEDEVVALAEELAATGELPVDVTDIRVRITQVTDELPSPTDTQRVKERLLAGGWPVSDPFDDAS
jgi:hypothetical protein